MYLNILSSGSSASEASYTTDLSSSDCLMMSDGILMIEIMKYFLDTLSIHTTKLVYIVLILVRSSFFYFFSRDMIFWEIFIIR